MSFVLVPRRPHKNISPTVDAPTPPDEAFEQEVQQRVQQELEKLRPIALSEAKTAAEEAARAALQPLKNQFQNALSALEDASDQLTNPLANKEQSLAELALDMAFQLARHIVRAQVTQDRTPLLKLVTDLLQEANVERTPQQNLIVRLSTADMAFLKDHLNETNVNLIADTSISTGGALVELAATNGDPLDKTEWDARLESRFDLLHQALLPTPQVEE